MTNFYNIYSSFSFNIRKGMEEKFLHYFEHEIIKKAHDCGCLSYWMFRDERDKTHILFTGYWSRNEDAYKFENYIKSHEKSFHEYCNETPTFKHYKAIEGLHSTNKERRSA